MDSVNDIRLDYRRLKSSRGRFPVCGVELRNSARGHAEVAFSFAEAPASNSAAAPPFDLETLACSLPSYPLADQAELVERIRGAAQVCGPLLGEPTPESLTDWMAEIRIAQAALGIQRAINGDAPLNGPGVPVVKSRLVDERGNAVFTSFCLSLACGLEGETQLEGMFPRMPWMKRFSDEGSCDYAFVCADSLEGQRIIDLHLITFAQDVPTVDYSFMTAYFDALGHDVSALGADFGGASASRLANPGSTRAEEAPLDKSDVAHLQHLVYALIALHTEPVHVDLFKSDGSRDFLAFGTYLSSLWYDFAMRLGQVKVGYCVQCGRGFSLTGHRGMSKEYCSEACRTQAKNERRRDQVARLRAAFMEGETVAAIAADVYAEMAKRPAQEAVRKSLRTWPELKRAVEDDLKRGDGAFTRRCVDEGAVDEAWLARKIKALGKR